MVEPSAAQGSSGLNHRFCVIRKPTPKAVAELRDPFRIGFFWTFSGGVGPAEAGPQPPATAPANLRFAQKLIFAEVSTRCPGRGSFAERQDAAGGERIISGGFLCLDRGFDLGTRTTSCPGYPKETLLAVDSLLRKPIRRGRDGTGARACAGYLLQSARQSLQRFQVLFARALHDFLGQLGAGRGAVPGLDRLQVIAEELLVEARLRAAWAVIIGGPEARAVGRENFVREEDAPGDRLEAEFELRIREDDAALGGVGGGPSVEIECQVAQFVVALFAEQRDGLLRREILIVAVVVLARGREKRLGQPVGFAQAGRDGLAADGDGARDIPPSPIRRDGRAPRTRRERFRNAARASGGHRTRAGRRPRAARNRAHGSAHWLSVSANQCRDSAVRILPLSGIKRRHDHVVGRDAVRSDQPDFVLPGVDVAHLAAAEKFHAGVGQSRLSK